MARRTFLASTPYQMAEAARCRKLLEPLIGEKAELLTFMAQYHCVMGSSSTGKWSLGQNAGFNQRGLEAVVLALKLPRSGTPWCGLEFLDVLLPHR